MEPIDYTDEEKDRLFGAIFYGIITVSKLPKKLYQETAKTLKNGLYQGYGGTLLEFEFGSPDYNLLKELRENIYIFSGAKTATQVLDIKSLMYEGDRVLGLHEFKKKALQRFNTYNKDYLDSEYITAQTSASSAATFNEAMRNKDLFPRLRSVAIVDQYTAPECLRMNGVIASIDNPIWNHNIAPRHFRCRCHEEKLDKYDAESSTSKSELKRISKENDKDMSPLFKMNPAKDKIVFSPNHAYFDIGKKYKVLAKKNFNLPIPEKDE